MSLVSIIVPVYNTAEYVEECIQSILSQSYKNIELILVNDGSQDGSGDICKKYESRSNVFYIEQNNKGVTYARKRGVEISKGEWILFVDSDDYLLYDAIETMIGMSIGVDIVIGSDQREKLKKEPDQIDREQYAVRLYERSITVGIAPKLYRRRLFNFKSFDIPCDLLYGEDWLMNLQIAMDNSKDIRVCKTPVYFYRFNPSSVSHNFIYPLDYIVILCRKADQIVENKMQMNDLIIGAAKMRMWFLVVLLKFHKYEVDRNHLFFKETKQCLKKAGLYTLSKRLLLNYPSERTYQLSCFIYRLEQPVFYRRIARRLIKMVK